VCASFPVDGAAEERHLDETHLHFFEGKHGRGIADLQDGHSTDGN
jgi:hypothetical protein